MLRTYFQETFYDMPVDVAQKYAMVIREAILTGKAFEGEKKKGFFLSKQRGFEDKMYVGNIHAVESHLRWNDEQLQDDDEIINVVVIDGPVTRDGDGCSYGSKDHRDQIMYANTIPQVIGHVIIVNTPGGAASSRVDYEQAIQDCREKGKPTVAWIDGLCCSAGQLVAALCDRTIVMAGRDEVGCIGTMCAFWGVPNGAVDQDGYRYIDLVSVSSPDKNAEYREAVDGKTEKLQAELDKLGDEFRETVKANRPNVTEEHLTGKTFYAEDVMDALVDEIGDFNRAIEAVFELAGGTLTAVRLMTAGPKEGDGEESHGKEPEEMAKLNEQQKQAIANSRGNLMIADDGHVKTVVEGFLGPETVEVANPQNNKEMTEEKKKAAEAEAAAAAEKDPAEEQPKEETMENAQAEIERITETLHNAEALVEEKDKVIAERDQAIAEKDSTIAALEQEKTDLQGDMEGKAVEIEQLTSELEGVKENLASAEVTIEERDKTIDQLKADNDTLNGLVAKKDETIEEMRGNVEKLQKQVAELQAENAELSGKPAQMVGEAAGIPANNGSGDAPKQKPRIKSGMTYEEIRAVKKAEL